MGEGDVTRAVHIPVKPEADGPILINQDQTIVKGRPGPIYLLLPAGTAWPPTGYSAFRNNATSMGEKVLQTQVSVTYFRFKL